eukprot:scaffold2430_cov159-Amphora_coffeaeformis.AAC.3
MTANCENNTNSMRSGVSITTVPTEARYTACIHHTRPPLRRIRRVAKKINATANAVAVTVNIHSCKIVVAGEDEDVFVVVLVDDNDDDDDDNDDDDRVMMDEWIDGSTTYGRRGRENKTRKEKQSKEY